MNVHKKRVFMDVSDATLNEALKMVNANQEKNKKIRHMSSTQRKRRRSSVWQRLSTTQKVAIVGGAVALAFLGVGGVAAAATAHRSMHQKRLDDIRPDVLPNGRIENLSADEMKSLVEKTSIDDLTDEEWAYMMETSPEHAEEWVVRDDDLRDMSLEEFDELKDFSDYSGIDFDDVAEWKC